MDQNKATILFFNKSAFYRTRSFDMQNHNDLWFIHQPYLHTLQKAKKLKYTTKEADAALKKEFKIFWKTILSEPNLKNIDKTILLMINTPSGQPIYANEDFTDSAVWSCYVRMTDRT